MRHLGRLGWLWTRIGFGQIRGGMVVVWPPSRASWTGSVAEMSIGLSWSTTIH